MERSQTTPASERPQPKGLSAVAQGDRRWAQRHPVWREREAALPWPVDLLDAFSLRMASHGMSISRPLMLSDKCYALQQLVHGQTMGDETLRLLAVQMFRHFESRQSGLALYH